MFVQRQKEFTHFWYSFQIPIPEYGRLVKSIKEFYCLAQSIAHFAVKRSRGYFHHFIIVSVNDVKEKVWEYFVGFSTWIKGGGEVQNNNFKDKKEDIENDIKNENMYVIEAPNYPKTDAEKQTAIERFCKRLGENAYNLACNNCEHLVSYILTGKPYSEQIRKAGKWIMCKVDAASIAINGVWHALKWSSCLLATIPAKRVMNAAISTVVDEVNRLTMNALMKSSCEMPVHAAKATQTICNGAAKKLGCEPNHILKNKKCGNVANKTSKEALKETAKIAFVTTGIVESVFAGYEISRLKEQRQENHINEHDYKRAVTTTVSGAAGATFGSVGGGVLGQALCPIPGLGFFIGSTVGNLFGRLGASVAAGQIFDEVTSN